MGTALSQDGSDRYALQIMSAATVKFEQLAEPADWAIAHQKMALTNTTFAVMCLRHKASPRTHSS